MSHQPFMSDTGVIILSAGNSSRLGQPKQLLSYRGRSLINGLVETVSEAGIAPCIVVLGAYREIIGPEIPKTAQIVYNELWQEGMGSSIRTGVMELLRIVPEIKNVLIMVSDQPFITAALLDDMIARKAECGKEIVACSYNNIIGTPVLFGKRFFEELISLKGSGGARKILEKYPDCVQQMPFEDGSTDIDTEEDYKNLLKNKTGR